MSTMEYPVVVTVVGLGEGVSVRTTVWVVSDPSIVFVETRESVIAGRVVTSVSTIVVGAGVCVTVSTTVVC